MNRGLAWLVFPMLACCGPKQPAEEAGGRLADVGGGEAGEGGGGGVASGEVGLAIDDAKDSLAELDARLDKAREAGSDDAVTLAQDRIALLSFLAHLERCGADESHCPPRLDEPELPSEYDVASGELKGAFAASADEWPDAAKTIAANACACRTRACATWILAELERWTIALSAKVLDAAAEDETRARECVHARITGE